MTTIAVIGKTEIIDSLSFFKNNKTSFCGLEVIKIENEIELNLSDTINSVNIVGHIRNLSVHKSNKGEILEIKDGKLVKIIPYENKE